MRIHRTVAWGHPNPLKTVSGDEMTSRDFCYWLQGYFEVAERGGSRPEALSPSQVEAVKAHLAMVFKHEIDPSFGDEKKQKELNDIHNVVLRC